MNFFTAWFRRRDEANHAASHRKGYDWAAGELLRGRDPESVEAECDWMPPRQFDEGVIDAIRQFETITRRSKL